MNILATIDSTEIVDTLTNAQENMQQNVEEVAKNPGIIRTYFENLVPDLISFGLQVVIAILIYVVGAKIIKAILKMMNRSMERAGTDIGVKQFLSTVIKYALHHFDYDYPKFVRYRNDVRSCIDWFRRSGSRSCIAGKPCKYCRWCFDSVFKTVSCG